jgi:AcrR family transcriptional regulator
MGRIAGVAPEETRKLLLKTAAAVFARQGYDGASISQITSEAGLSSGSVYAHFSSKAELFVAALKAHAEGGFDRLLGGGAGLASFLTARGEALDRRTAAEQTLLIEAIVAAKRDPAVADLLADSIVKRESLLAGLLSAAQAAGELDPAVPPAAGARFTLMLALGSILVGALDLPPIPHDDWSALIGRLVENLKET